MVKIYTRPHACRLSGFISHNRSPFVLLLPSQVLLFIHDFVLLSFSHMKILVRRIWPGYMTISTYSKLNISITMRWNISSRSGFILHLSSFRDHIPSSRLNAFSENTFPGADGTGISITTIICVQALISLGVAGAFVRSRADASQTGSFILVAERIQSSS